jgi:hypothetical protein
MQNPQFTITRGRPPAYRADAATTIPDRADAIMDMLKV